MAHKCDPYLVIDSSAEESLPEACVWCNSTTDVSNRDQDVVYRPGLGFATRSVLRALLRLMIAHKNRFETSINLPICSRCIKRPDFYANVGAAVFMFAVALGFASPYVVETLTGEQPTITLLYFVVVLFFFAILALLYPQARKAMLKRRMVDYADEQIVWISDTDPSYREQLPQWTGESLSELRSRGNRR
ncbi:MAG: hypothetical protein WBD31_18155 [Rubripirellula sp.]